MGKLPRNVKKLVTVLVGALWLTAVCSNLALASAQWTIGNTPANVSNNGLAVAQGDTIYYIDHVGDIYANSNEKIYKLQKGSNSPQLLVDDEAWNLNICGDWLYYSNWSDHHRIYKIRIDGSEKTKVVDDPANQVTLLDGWLVYVKWTNTTGARDNNIYKVNPAANPQREIRLNSDQSENLNVADGWIYYSNASDEYRPYKIRMDGTERTRITNDKILFMAVADGWIYYSNASDSEKLYRITTDGTGRTKLSNDRTGFINAYDGYIYYTNGSDGDSLYRIKVNGTERYRVCDMGVGPMPVNIVSGLVYYNHLFISPEQLVR